MEKENNTAETPLEDFKNDALDHYEKISINAHHWNSFIPKAIKAYDPKKDQELSEFTEKYNKLKDVFELLLENNCVVQKLKYESRDQAIDLWLKKAGLKEE